MKSESASGKEAVMANGYPQARCTSVEGFGPNKFVIVSAGTILSSKTQKSEEAAWNDAAHVIRMVKANEGK